MHTGTTCNRITLTPNVMDTILYPSGAINVDVMNYGTGDIYLNWNGDASVGGEDSLLLKQGVGYSIREGRFIREFTLNIISDSAAVVQVVKSR